MFGGIQSKLIVERNATDSASGSGAVPDEKHHEVRRSSSQNRLDALNESSAPFVQAASSSSGAVVAALSVGSNGAAAPLSLPIVRATSPAVGRAASDPASAATAIGSSSASHSATLFGPSWGGISGLLSGLTTSNGDAKEAATTSAPASSSASSVSSSGILIQPARRSPLFGSTPYVLQEKAPEATAPAASPRRVTSSVGDGRGSSSSASSISFSVAVGATTPSLAGASANAYEQRIQALETELAMVRASFDVERSQMQSHLEHVQSIAMENQKALTAATQQVQSLIYLRDNQIGVSQMAMALVTALKEKADAERQRHELQRNLHAV